MREVFQIISKYLNISDCRWVNFKFFIHLEGSYWLNIYYSWNIHWIRIVLLLIRSAKHTICLTTDVIIESQFNLSFQRNLRKVELLFGKEKICFIFPPQTGHFNRWLKILSIVHWLNEKLWNKYTKLEGLTIELHIWSYYLKYLKKRNMLVN